MILLPAVDIRGGRAVRLVQGDFDRETVYADSPVAAARTWVDAGARWLHLVDLDGARAGEPRALDHLRAVRREVGVPVQWGGGLRSLEHVAAAADAGADRIVLGTAAHRDPALLEDAVRRWPDRVSVAVDVRGGRVAVAGWAEDGAPADEVLPALADRGVERVVYTSVDRDGMLEGLDPAEVDGAARAFPGQLVYSGGVASVDNLHALRALALPRLAGVISGKALYEKRFSVRAGQAALDGD